MNKSNLLELIINILLFIFMVVISYSLTAAIFHWVCESFGWNVWSYQTSFVVWILVMLFNSTIVGMRKRR